MLEGEAANEDISEAYWQYVGTRTVATCSIAFTAYFRWCHSVLMTSALPVAEQMLCHQFKPAFFSFPADDQHQRAIFSLRRNGSDRGSRVAASFKSRHGLAGIVCSRTPSHRPAQFEFVDRKSSVRFSSATRRLLKILLEDDTCTQSAHYGPTSLASQLFARNSMLALDNVRQYVDTVGISSALIFLHFNR